MTERQAAVAAAAGLLMAWAWATLPHLTIGAANLRLVEVFQTDEVLHVTLLREALQHRTLRLVFGSYGHLYFNAALLPLQARALFGPIPDLQILFAMRLISALFTLGTVVLLAGWVRRTSGLAPALAAALLLLLCPTVMQWSSMSHPDTAQMFFVTLALYATSRAADTYSRRALALAAAAAGLAFATKYAGMFVLPLLAVVAWLHAAPMPPDGGRRVLRDTRLAAVGLGLTAVALAWLVSSATLLAFLSESGHAEAARVIPLLDRVRFGVRVAGAALVVAGATGTCWRWRPSLARPLGALTDFAAACAAFVAAFVLTSPYSLRRLAFVKGLYFESSRLAGGSATALTAAWAAEAWRELGPVLLLSAAVGAMACWRLRMSGRERSSSAIVAAWLVLYGLVLVTRARSVAPQYLLPLAPALAWLAATGIAQVAALLPARRMAAAALLATAIVAVSVPRYLGERVRWEQRVASNGSVRGGAWLQCEVVSDARIAYDYMTYVPPDFAEATPTWGGTAEWRRQVDPDVIVVNPVVAGFYDAQPPGDPRRRYYACLADGSCGFERWFANDGVRIYGRPERSARVRRDAADDACTARAATHGTAPDD